ncbi:uncharacterized protein [Triticum aestivum]|uniref:uncharacterized protein isoform X2 n=1 Tax=Triticum aestivum TaxID=4565 RepID=UPI001D026975|nr:uncharacterized protein LOC123059551 isoform X2 [Triticum aestivum]
MMPDRRGATLLEDLPEDIIDKILVRLPSKDVGRCRAVSTSWCTATSTPKFMLDHHQLQPSLPIIDGRGLPTNFVLFHSAGTNQQLWPFSRCLKHHSEPHVEHVLYNTIIGFYQHLPTQEYRVLWVSEPWHPYKSSLHVLTVGSNVMRHISVRMETLALPSMEKQQQLLKGLRSKSCCPPSVHHRGSLHWCPYDATEIGGHSSDIIVFDTEVESFRWMRSPTRLCHHRKLFDMNGTLAFWGSLTPSLTAMDVWAMQDDVWTFKYKIDVSTLEVTRQLYSTSFKKKKRTPLDSTVQWLDDMVVLNDRELLIMFNSKHVLRCDIDGNFLGMVNIGKSQYCMMLNHCRLKESIIPIPSH